MVAAKKSKEVDENLVLEKRKTTTAQNAPAIAAAKEVAQPKPVKVKKAGEDDPKPQSDFDDWIRDNLDEQDKWDEKMANDIQFSDEETQVDDGLYIKGVSIYQDYKPTHQFKKGKRVIGVVDNSKVLKFIDE